MAVEIALGRRVESWAGNRFASTRSLKLPRQVRPLTATEAEADQYELEFGGMENGSPKRGLEPILHHFTHEMECLWWLSLWSVTARLGKWEAVKDVFIPFASTGDAEARERFLMNDTLKLDALVEELPGSLRPVCSFLKISREYLRFRYLELAKLGEKAREDPAEHSHAFKSLRNLVNVQIPSEAPPLEHCSHPFWTIRESQGSLRAIQSTTDKRIHPAF